MSHSALRSILRPGGITPLFQPVVRITPDSRSIHYYETLTRGPHGTNMEQPNVLFEYVRLKREEITVDRACIAAALQAATALPPSASVGLNVHASTLGRDQRLPNFLREEAQKNSISLDRIIIEIVEHAPPWDTEGFLSALMILRSMGARIALDDVGLGQSNYKMIFDVGADYLKIDRYFVHGSHDDPKRQAVIESIYQLAHRFGGMVIAEGLELERDFETLAGMGIELMQGFLFAHAQPAAAVAREVRNVRRSMLVGEASDSC